jgi:hypothetical protein
MVGHGLLAAANVAVLVPCERLAWRRCAPTTFATPPWRCGSRPAPNPKEVSVRAGHTSVSFTLDRYGHLFPGHDAELRDRLDAMHIAR